MLRRWYESLFDTPLKRLVGRAVWVAIVAAAAVIWNADEPWSTAAITAAALAAGEALTKLNPYVGLNKSGDN